MAAIVAISRLWPSRYSNTTVARFPHLSASVRRSTHFVQALATERVLQTSMVLYFAARRCEIGIGKREHPMTLIERLESRREALTVQEVAELLGVSDKHVYEMTADGTLPAFHVGRSVRLDPQDVADWLRKKRSPAVESRDERHSGKGKFLNGTGDGSDHRTVDRVLRNKVRHLEAASAIDDSANGRASGKTP